MNGRPARSHEVQHIPLPRLHLKIEYRIGERVRLGVFQKLTRYVEIHLVVSVVGLRILLQMIPNIIKIAPLIEFTQKLYDSDCLLSQGKH